ncbi:MAG: hypothetical protein ABI970_16670, partial [Chloroflexota bacterium]
SGWEYNHRGSEGEIDVVVAAQIARGVYTALNASQPTCQDTLGDFKQTLLRSMRDNYAPEDLARLISFVDEVVGSVDYNDCSYSIANQFVQRVDWGATSAVEIGRSVSEIFRTVRTVIPSGGCDGTFKIIQEIVSHIEDVPPDGTLIGTLYKVVGDATENHYVTEDSCDYTLAKTFLGKVKWDGLDSAHIVSLVSDTFKITYKMSSDSTCDNDPALAITAMLLDDAYRFPPDASVIQNSYDAASGKVVVTPEATPIVN